MLVNSVNTGEKALEKVRQITRNSTLIALSLLLPLRCKGYFFFLYFKYAMFIPAGARWRSG